MAPAFLPVYDTECSIQQVGKTTANLIHDSVAFKQSGVLHGSCISFLYMTQSAASTKHRPAPNLLHQRKHYLRVVTEVLWTLAEFLLDTQRSTLATKPLKSVPLSLTRP